MNTCGPGPLGDIIWPCPTTSITLLFGPPTITETTSFTPQTISTITPTHNNIHNITSTSILSLTVHQSTTDVILVTLFSSISSTTKSSAAASTSTLSPTTSDIASAISTSRTETLSTSLGSSITKPDATSPVSLVVTPKTQTTAIIGGIASGVSVLFIAGFLVFLWHRRHRKQDIGISEPFSKLANMNIPCSISPSEANIIHRGNRTKFCTP
ncbi:hypothetical protein L208DRAFT_80983 [Tricholoma matsutake]|nr:hypothetical protein L208DRAFT_80983 [Tricholoma matsutake 945]